LTNAPAPAPPRPFPVALQLLAAFALLAALLLRLRRIARPVFAPSLTPAPGVVLGPVTLRGQTLGYSLRCQGREVFASPGPRPFARVLLHPDGRTLSVTAPPRQARINLADCAAEITDLPH